jgi:6-pyruvoyltetrahydropterin/6-carboxytetrahydropterin synthase
MKVTVNRIVHFNAAHRLHNEKWDEKRNLEVFGKCNNPNYHGHNYTIEAKVKGLINQETGYVIDTKVLKTILEEEILDKFDHRNLNLDVQEFKMLNPTAENIAVVIYNKLKPRLDKNHELTIILHETERNSVEYSGE